MRGFSHAPRKRRRARRAPAGGEVVRAQALMEVTGVAHVNIEQGHGPTVAGEGIVCLRCGEPYGHFHGDVGWHIHCTNLGCVYCGGDCDGLPAKARRVWGKG